MPPARLRPRVMKVAVVGAGVMGVAAAAGLVRGGAEVTLVEGAGTGAGTSSRGAGLVCEGMWHATSLALARRSMVLLADLAREAEARGHPFRFHVVGSSTLLPEALVPAARRLAAFQRAGGAEVRTLSPAQAQGLPRHEGVRLDDAAEVLHYPRDGWALPRLYAEALDLALQEAGMRHLRGRARLRRDGARVAVEVDGDPLDADAVVVAAGVDSRAILRGAGLDAPLLAYRTQAMRYAHPDAHGAPILHDAVQGFYLRPGPQGQLLAGDGTTTTPEDPAAWRREADEGFVRSVLHRLRHRLPRLAAGAPADAWAGLDAATPDRLLLAGRHPDAEGLWLLAGGNGHGFMRAPAAGESLAALVLGAPPPVDLSAFDPGRFAGRMGDAFSIREGYSLEG